MAPIVDLHMHTTFSDGIKTPEELITFAKARGVNVMSINDHDTVKGVINMLSLQIDGITVLCGIEMSSKFTDRKTIHIAGYFPKDTDFSSLQEELTKRINNVRYHSVFSILHKELFERSSLLRIYKKEEFQSRGSR